MFDDNGLTSETSLVQSQQSITEASSPPAWSQAPAEFQADLAALDRLDDALWRIARSQRNDAETASLHEMLAMNASDALTAAERFELNGQVAEADRFMLRKARQWRGSTIRFDHEILT